MKNERKSIWRKIRKKILSKLAKILIKKHKPEVIGIMGSSGLFVKSLISCVFGESFNLRCTKEEKPDSDLEFIFDILGGNLKKKIESNIFLLILLFLKEFFWGEYPKILVLYYRTQKIGDIDILLDIVRPNVVLLTNTDTISYNFYEKQEDFLLEKRKLVTSIQQRGDGCFLVLENDKFAKDVKKQVSFPVYTYSTKKKSSFYATGIHLSVHKNVLHGISFKMNYNGNSVPIRIENIVVKSTIDTVLGVITLASLYKINMVDIAQRLKNYSPPISKMKYLNGINNSKVISDISDISPEDIKNTLNSLYEINSNRKILVLGKLSESYDFSQQIYKDLAKKIVSKEIDFVIFIGLEFEVVLDYLLKNSFILDGNLFLCDSVSKTVKILERIISPDDLILIKSASYTDTKKIIRKITKD